MPQLHIHYIMQASRSEKMGTRRMRPELVIVDDVVVAVRVSGQEFPYKSDKAIVPKKVLTGFHLSEIPKDLIIKLEGSSGIELSSFEDNSALALVEVTQRRKYWDGDVGLAPYMKAFRQAIRERDDAEEIDFQDDDDYILLVYDITISEDLEIQEAINRIEHVITAIERRASQISQSGLDPLTSLLDRGRFDADLMHALEYSKADSLGLLVIDLDKFKTINDTYGHEAGDEVLKKAAGVVLLTCESKGSCYRYGGDEMIVLLPKHSLEQATAVAEQIRVGVAELKFEKSSENITASIGLTSYPEVTKALDDIFSDADAMVYQAKDDGGNAVRGAMASELNQNSARTIRLDIASRVEAVELWMRLESGNGQNYSIIIKNDSDEDVTVEAITLKKDKVYLSEPSKPLPSDDWKIGKRSGKTISFLAKTPPVNRLQIKEPQRGPGEIVEIDIVVWGRVLGRLKIFSHTILATADYANRTMTEY
jgi:diguanylate cyclase (GGDEF)-like protein